MHPWIQQPFLFDISNSLVGSIPSLEYHEDKFEALASVHNQSQPIKGGKISTLIINYKSHQIAHCGR